jgi:autotransporter-associated beta strand protein
VTARALGSAAAAAVTLGGLAGLVLPTTRSQQALGASGSWSGAAGDGLWQTPGNWDNVPGSIGTTTNTDVATFNGIPTSRTVTIDSGRNIGGIFFDPNVSAGTGTFVAVGADRNAGNPLILSNGGTIQLSSVTFSGADPTNSAINAPLTLAGSTYNFINNSGDINNSLGALQIFGDVTNGTSALSTITLDGDHGSTSSSRAQFVGVISDGTLGGVTSVVKNGVGTWKMDQNSSAPNTYSGDTIINAGALRAGGSSSNDSLGGWSPNSHYVIRSAGTMRNSANGTSAKSVEIDFGGTLSASTVSSVLAALNLTTNSGPALQLNYANPTSTATQVVSCPLNLTGTTPGSGGITLFALHNPDGTGTPQADLGPTTGQLNLGTIPRVFDIGKGADDQVNAIAHTYDLRVRGPIIGTGGIIKTGPGTLRLDNASQGYSGVLEVDAGEVRISNANPFSQSVNIVVKAGATLSVSASASTTLNLNVNSGPALFLDFAGGNGNPVSAPFSFTGTTPNEGGIKMSAGASTGPADLGGSSSPLDLGPLARKLDIAHGAAANAYDLRLRGPVSGSGGIVKTGDGILRIDNTANTFTGTVEIQQGTLEVNNSNALTGVPALLIDGGSLQVFGGQTQTFSSVNVTKGSIVASNTLSTVAAPNFTFNVAATDTASVETVLADAGGAAPLVKNGDGSVTLSGALAYTGTTTVNAGTLSLATDLTASSSLSVTGGKLELRVTALPNRVVHTPSVSVTGTGKIDIKHNKLITATPVGTATGGVYTGVSRYIQLGRGTGGTWNGSSGIITSMSDATAGSNYTSIGIATGAQVVPSSATETATWAGQTITGSDTLVMYTYGGDANLDGKINIDDYGHIDTSIGIGLKGWYNGDFNYDGVINIDDYGIIDVNIGIQGAAFPTGAGLAAGLNVVAVPEPACFTLWGVAAIGLARRPRRRQRAAPSCP